MAQRQNSLRNKSRCASSRRLRSLAVAMLLFQADAVCGAQADSGPAPMKPLSAGQIFIFFLTLGPIKIIGSFARLTQAADTCLAHRIALRAILFPVFALLSAALGLQIILNSLQRLWP